MRTERISAVVPVFNSRDCLSRCLDAITVAGQRYGLIELIVVDNGSTDGSYEMLLSAYGSTAKILQVKHVTIGRVRNVGGQIATGKYLCFIDSDCVISEDYFKWVVQTFETVHADATGSMVALPPLPTWIERTWQDLHEPPEDGYTHFLNSGNFVVKKEVFEQSGGFDERLLTGEDSEYCQRLTSSGFKIYQARTIRAIHLRNPKSLSTFFTKNVWHGLGMFGTWRRSWFDKPVVMTFLFLSCCAAGIAVLFLSSTSLGVRFCELILLSFVAPLLTVTYRAVKARRLRWPFRSVLLYWVYYAARSYALIRIPNRRSA